MSWKIDYEPKVRKELAEQLRAGLLTSADFTALRRWVDLILERGLASVQNATWHDHPLEGEWTGFRSASFSPAGRVIYRVEDGRLIVVVVRVTAIHNYRR